MARPALQAPAVAGLVLVLLIAAGSLARARELRYPDPAISEDSLYLTSGETLKRLTAGYNALASDLYWIRALQYFGGVRLRLAASSSAGAAIVSAGGPASDYALLYPLLDLTTTLDPRFNIAYRFGAIFLAEPFPGGAGRPDQAIALLEKGSRVRPDKWEYLQDLGFVHYWWRHDYQAAAEWFARAADVPGAPWFLRSLAATTLAEGGDRSSSRVMWQAIRESAEIDWLKTEADRRLIQLRAMDEIDEWQRRIDRISVARGSRVMAWPETAAGAPSDPADVPYVIEDGRVTLSRSSPLFPLPDEPQHTVDPVP